MEEATYRITQIEVQKKNDERVSIFLDGQFAFGLNREVLIRHPLHEGDAVTESQIDDVLLVDERVWAKDKALRFLAQRAHSISEIRKKLSDRDVSERTIDRVVEDLVRVNLLNDREFAEIYTRSRLIARPMGRRMLQQELQQKGLSPELIESTLDAAYEKQSEFDLATALAEKRIDRYGKRPLIQAKKKMLDFLSRRGFAWDTVYDVINSLAWPSENNETDE